MLQFALRATARLVENNQRGTLKEIIDLQHKKEQQDRILRQQQEQTLNLTVENVETDVETEINAIIKTTTNKNLSLEEEQKENNNNNFLQQDEAVGTEHAPQRQQQYSTQEQQERLRKAEEFLNRVPPELFNVVPWSATHLFDILKTDRYFDQQLFLLPISQDLEQEGPFSMGNNSSSSSISTFMYRQQQQQQQQTQDGTLEESQNDDFKNSSSWNSINNNNNNTNPSFQWKRLCIIFGNGNVMLSPASSSSSSSQQQSLATNKDALAFCLQLLVSENNQVVVSEQKVSGSNDDPRHHDGHLPFSVLPSTTTTTPTSSSTFLRTIKKRREIFIYKGKELVSFLLSIFGSDLVNHLGGFAENVFDLGVCYNVLLKAGIINNNNIDGASSSSSSSSFFYNNSSNETPLTSFGSLVESCFPSFVERQEHRHSSSEKPGEDAAAAAAVANVDISNNQTAEEQKHQKSSSSSSSSITTIIKIRPHETIVSCVSVASTLCYRNDHHYSQSFFYSILSVLLLRAVAKNRLDLCQQYQAGRGGGGGGGGMNNNFMMNNNNNNNRGLDYTVKLLTRTEYYCCLMTHHGIAVHRGKLSALSAQRWKEIALCRYQLFLISEALVKHLIQPPPTPTPTNVMESNDSSTTTTTTSTSSEPATIWAETLQQFCVFDSQLFDERLDVFFSSNKNSKNEETLQQDASSTTLTNKNSANNNNNNNKRLGIISEIRKQVFDQNQNRDLLSLISPTDVWRELLCPALRNLVIAIERAVSKKLNDQQQQKINNNNIRTSSSLSLSSSSLENVDSRQQQQQQKQQQQQSEVFLFFIPTLIPFIKSLVQNQSSKKPQELLRDCLHNVDLTKILTAVTDHLLGTVSSSSSSNIEKQQLSSIDLGLASVAMISMILPKLNSMIFEVRAANQLETHRYIGNGHHHHHDDLQQQQQQVNFFDRFTGKINLPTAFRGPASEDENEIDKSEVNNYNSKNNQINMLIDKLLAENTVDQIHSDFTCVRSDTARIFSSNPSVQTIPRADKSLLRRCLTTTTITTTTSKTTTSKTDQQKATDFRSKQLIKQKLVSLDYSQFELRVLAHLCGDENLIQMFREDRDVISELSNDILGIIMGGNSSGGNNNNQQQQQRQSSSPSPLLSTAVRTITKIIVYGILFGIGDDALASRCREQLAEMSSAQPNQQEGESSPSSLSSPTPLAASAVALSTAFAAAESINPLLIRAHFHRKFPRVRPWMDQVSATSRIDGSVSTLSGFTRRFIVVSSNQINSNNTTTTTINNNYNLQHHQDAAAAAIPATVTATTKHQQQQASSFQKQLHFNTLARQSVATLVQGTAADILKIAIGRIFAAAVLARSTSSSSSSSTATTTSPIARNFYLIMAVHDELVFVVEDDDESKILNTVRMIKKAMMEAGEALMRERFGDSCNNNNSNSIMETKKIALSSSFQQEVLLEDDSLKMLFSVPLVVKASIGDSLGELKQIDDM